MKKMEGDNGGHIAIPAMRCLAIPDLGRNMSHGELTKYAQSAMARYMILTLQNGPLNHDKRHAI